MIVSRTRAPAAAGMCTTPGVARLTPRFRPIAPKPGGAGPAPAVAPTSATTALSSTFSLPKRTGRGRKRRGAAVAAASPKRFKKPSCMILPRVEGQREIRTLPLLPVSEPALAASSSPSCVSAVTTTTSDAAPELELRLGHSSAEDSETGISSCSSSSRSPGFTSASSSPSPASACLDLKLLEQAYSSCQEPVVIADDQDHILWSNPAFNSSSSSFGTPVPVSSFLVDDTGTRVVVWAFWKGSAFVGPCSKVSRPRPVRATPLLVVPSPWLSNV